jgi:Eco57I restriction-modification methylase
LTHGPLPSGVGTPSARWLFSKHFLSSRLPDWAEFQALETSGLLSDLRELWKAERETLLGKANEGETEERFIRPVLRLLGQSFALFADIPGTGKTPDYFFYTNDEQRRAAERAGSEEKVARAVAVGDAKRFDLPLDKRSFEGDPVAQIRDYVLLSRRPFGILTNGRVWRLYARDSGLLERACHEVDLVALLEGTADDLRYFAAFFGAAAFREGSDGRTFLARALEDSELHAVEVTDALERAVFAAIPPIATGLLRGEARTREALDDGFANSLVFLYRVLFCLFAEARRLLPIDNPDYRRYSIADHRLEVAGLLDQHRQLSTTSDNLFGQLQALFHMIYRGDPALGVTEYDGDLFNPAQHAWLEGRSVPDVLLAPVLDGLYRVGGELVDFRDLSVRTLGTVYERLLAWELEEQNGELVLKESPRRHEFGSYFTPEPVVDAIVERTIDPVMSGMSGEVVERGMSGDDALEHLLSVRILDPAMGSGHFLVGAAEFVAQAIATDPSYDGELSLDELRRLVAERCLYGVDLNPLAVELARLSLWLVTAEPDEPLTFLANLRIGDSLVGADTESLLDPTTGLLEAHLAAAAGELLRQVNELEHRATRTGSDAREKRRLFNETEGLRLPLEVFADSSLERFRPPSKDHRPRLHWPLEFPEVFVDERGEAREGGGFDAVIGNPPYIRVQEIGRDVADYCRARFGTARGSFDAYLVFLERALSLLSPQGRLGFIVPNKLFKLDFAQRMRGYLSEGELVADVLDFGASQVFAEVTNYTCILILDRAGVAELQYRAIRGRRDEVLAELAAPEAVPAQSFETRRLGSEPWVLVPPEEAAVIRAAGDGSERLDAVTRQIYQGLITSADKVYVLEDRGEHAGLRVVYSRASEEEVKLEPDLLHPLASGEDVQRYSFASLSQVLLFPYLVDGRSSRLLACDELARLPATWKYLQAHEEQLRGREHGKMGHDGWYGYVYPKNLAAHDEQKLGVPRLCERLRVAFDGSGVVYFDNVDVNGILLRADGASPLALLVLLNSRLLDWIFRRGSVPFQNEFWSANKQFIAGLPIRIPSRDETAEVDDLGRRLQSLASQISDERGGFLSWLASTVGAHRKALARRRELAAHELQGVNAIIAALVRARPSIDPRERPVHELIEREYRASVERLLPLLADLRAAEADADRVVYELYRLPAAMRTLVDAEYE